MAFNYSSRTIKIRIPKNRSSKNLFLKLLYIFYMIVLPVYLLPFGWSNVLLAFVLNHFMVSLIFTSVLVYRIFPILCNILMQLAMANYL